MYLMKIARRSPDGSFDGQALAMVRSQFRRRVVPFNELEILETKGSPYITVQYDRSLQWIDLRTDQRSSIHFRCFRFVSHGQFSRKWSCCVDSELKSLVFGSQKSNSEQWRGRKWVRSTPARLGGRVTSHRQSNLHQSFARDPSALQRTP